MAWNGRNKPALHRICGYVRTGVPTMFLDSPILNLLAWLSIPVAIVALNLLLRWVVTHTNLGVRGCSKMDPDELVTIARFANYIDAELWKSRLQAVGIACAVEGGTTSGMLRPFWLAAPDGLLRPGVKLLVRAADAQRASQVLRVG